MAERGILMSAPMVRATLDGTKTVTRRVVLPRPIDMGTWPDGVGYARYRAGAVVEDYPRCPYGVPGDYLYVRETWAAQIPGGNFNEITGSPNMMPQYAHIVYAATEKLADLCADSRGYRWRPSIHMPKRFARIWLRVTDVRVERVQDITREGAIAEGIERVGGNFSTTPWRNYQIGPEDPSAMNCASPVRSFSTLWDSLNASRGYGWDMNPWVWVVEFERCERPALEVRHD